MLTLESLPGENTYMYSEKSQEVGPRSTGCALYNAAASGQPAMHVRHTQICVFVLTVF